MNGIETYKPSGRFDALTIPAGLGLGLVGALGIGWLYQMAVDFIPFIYINLFLTIGFGIAIGGLVGFGARIGKCRNLLIASALAAVCAFAAEGSTLY